jgi:beta-lactamase class A
LVAASCRDDDRVASRQRGAIIDAATSIAAQEGSTRLSRRALLFTTIAAALLIGVGVARPAQVHARELSASCAALAEAAASHDIEVGFVLLDLKNGERCSFGEETEFRTASLYKLIVMAEAYHQNNRGEFSFGEDLVIEERHTRDDPPSLRPETPFEITRQVALFRMLQFSDNVSALALREELGTGAVALAPGRLGLENTQIGARFVTTPEDIATFFERLYAGRVVSRRASAEMIRILRGQEISDLIPRGLPAGTVVAHKTGLLEDVLHDAGIISGPSGDYVLVAMTRHEPTAEARDLAYIAIREISAMTYEVMSNIVRPVEPLEELLFSPPGVVDVGESVLAAGDSAEGAATPAAEAAEAERAFDAPGETATSAVPAPPAAAASVPATQAAPAEAPAAGAPNSSVAPAEVLPRPPAESASSFATSSVPSGTDSTGGSTVPWWRGMGTLAVLLAAAALVAGPIGTTLILRRTALRYAGPDHESPRTTERTVRAERGVVMRIGSKLRSVPAEDGSTDVVPAPATQVSEQPVLPSLRLERIASHFVEQAELLNSMRSQIEQETAPLQELLIRQASTMQQLLSNLEERLRPLNEYADHEQANLDALEERISEQGTDFVSRSFQEYIRQQRERIAETRQQIDEQRMPFLRYSEDQREAIEVALSRYDGEMDELEANLAQQREVMTRMVEAMRSDTFVAIRQFLVDRETAMAGLASAGAADPGEVGDSIRVLRDSIEGLAGKSEDVQSVLESADSSDERLSANGKRTPQALPEVVQNTPVTGRQGVAAANIAGGDGADGGEESQATG